MTVTRQNDSSCFLACLESFFADNGLSITQTNIIEDFPVESHKGLPNEGEFDFSKIDLLQSKYGFRMNPKPPVFNSLAPDDFIGAERMKDQDCHHMVRFSEYTETGGIRVMDPKIGGFDCWTREEFSRYRCYIFNVSLNQVAIIPAGSAKLGPQSQ